MQKENSLVFIGVAIQKCNAYLKLFYKLSSTRMLTIYSVLWSGNFALLADIDPKEVHRWYLSVYIDAFEWVEAPNTLGMSQFSDGGVVASKPYISSGAYINRMSNYCKTCHYDVKDKLGDRACPFNALYWDFLIRHKEKFFSNPRMGQMYRNWERQDTNLKSATLALSLIHI